MSSLFRMKQNGVPTKPPLTRITIARGGKDYEPRRASDVSLEKARQADTEKGPVAPIRLKKLENRSAPKEIRSSYSVPTMNRTEEKPRRLTVWEQDREQREREVMELKDRVVLLERLNAKSEEEDDKQARLMSMQLVMSQLETEKRELEHIVSRLEIGKRRVEDESSHKEEKMKTLLNEINQREREKTELKEELAILRRELVDAKEIKEQKLETLRQLHGDISSKDIELLTLKNRITELERLIEILRGEVKERDQKLSVLQDTVDKKGLEKKELEEQVAVLETQNKQLEEGKRGNEEKLRQLQAQQTMTRTEAHEQNSMKSDAHLKAVEKEMEKTANRLKELETIVTQYEFEREGLQQLVTSLQLRRAEMDGEMAERQRELTELQLSLAQSETETWQLRRQLALWDRNSSQQRMLSSQQRQIGSKMDAVYQTSSSAREKNLKAMDQDTTDILTIQTSVNADCHQEARVLDDVEKPSPVSWAHTHSASYMVQPSHSAGKTKLREYSSIVENPDAIDSKFVEVETNTASSEKNFRSATSSFDRKSSTLDSNTVEAGKDSNRRSSFGSKSPKRQAKPDDAYRRSSFDKMSAKLSPSSEESKNETNLRSATSSLHSSAKLTVHSNSSAQFRSSASPPSAMSVLISLPDMGEHEALMYKLQHKYLTREEEVQERRVYLPEEGDTSVMNFAMQGVDTVASFVQAQDRLVQDGVVQQVVTDELVENHAELKSPPPLSSSQYSSRKFVLGDQEGEIVDAEQFLPEKGDVDENEEEDGEEEEEEEEEEKEAEEEDAAVLSLTEEEITRTRRKLEEIEIEVVQKKAETEYLRKSVEDLLSMMEGDEDKENKDNNDDSDDDSSSSSSSDESDEYFVEVDQADFNYCCHADQRSCGTRTPSTARASPCPQDMTMVRTKLQELEQEVQDKKAESERLRRTMDHLDRQKMMAAEEKMQTQQKLDDLQRSEAQLKQLLAVLQLRSASEGIIPFDDNDDDDNNKDESIRDADGKEDEKAAEENDKAKDETVIEKKRDGGKKDDENDDEGETAKENRDEGVVENNESNDDKDITATEEKEKRNDENDDDKEGKGTQQEDKGNNENDNDKNVTTTKEEERGNDNDDKNGRSTTREDNEKGNNESDNSKGKARELKTGDDDEDDGDEERREDQKALRDAIVY